jgi:hypothetical protein
MYAVTIKRQQCRYSDWLRAGRQRVRSSSPNVETIFSSSMSSRPVFEPTQPPMQRVLGALSPGVKLPGRDADHSSTQILFTTCDGNQNILCNDREIGGYTRAVSRQRLGKHVPAKETTE